MYRLNEEKMFFDIADGQAVVINFVTGVYYGTNVLGSAILERLVKGNSPDEILTAVQTLPGCPEDMAEKVAGFVARLMEKEILAPGPTQPGGSEPIDANAIAEGFDLPLDEFAEVQDLLLADPIHEVDVEQGWPIFRDEPKEK